MIVVICAMSKERDALLKKMSNVKVQKGEKIYYHDETKSELSGYYFN